MATSRASWAGWDENGAALLVFTSESDITPNHVVHEYGHAFAAKYGALTEDWKKLADSSMWSIPTWGQPYDEAFAVSFATLFSFSVPTASVFRPGYTERVRLCILELADGVKIKDVVGHLERADFEYGRVSPKSSLTFHWNGPPVAEYADPLLVLVADAHYHVEVRGWDGISYHAGIWRDGTLYITRDMDAVLAACDDTYGNAHSYHVQLMLGQGQSLTNEMKATLRWLMAQYPSTYPHSKWSSTDCPGDEIRAFIEGGTQELTQDEFNRLADEWWKTHIQGPATLDAMKTTYNPIVHHTHETGQPRPA